MKKSLIGKDKILRTNRNKNRKVQRIHSKNATYQKFEVLQTNRNKRHRYKEFIIEGVRNINEAIKNNWEIVSFVYSFEENLSRWAIDTINVHKTKTNYELPNTLMRELSGKENTSELLAILKMKENEGNYTRFSSNPIIALFDRPSNKGNLGTLLRSCDAFGVEQLIVTGHAIDIYEPDVISASMGSFFRVPFVRLSDKVAIEKYMSELRQNYPSLQVIGAESNTGKNLYQVDLTTPILFLIGNEADGLNRYYLEISDTLVTIPMDKKSSATSFNVSCAATVLLYEAIRQRSM